MSKIPGKLKTEDLPQLIELVTGKSVLQLGCYCGRGTVVLARHARRTWVLDDFKHPEGLGGITEELKSNVERYFPADAAVNLLHGNGESWTVPADAPDLQPYEIGVVYRDADRREEERARDEMLAFSLLRVFGGVYAWHDDNHDLKWLVVRPVPVEVN